MKNSHKLSFFLLLFFSLGTLIAQQKFNAKGQQTGVIIIKFSTEQTSALDRAQKNSSENGKMQFAKQEGYVKTGITDIDKCNQKLKAFSMKRIFRHGGKFEEKHRKHGLHLWYEVTYNNSTTVNEAIDLYKKSPQIETAHARHKIEYADGYTNTSQTVILPKNNTTKQNTKASDFTGIPNDPEYSKQWHYNNTGQNGGTPGSDIKLEKAWEIEKGDARVIVSVIDGAVQTDHPDLKGNMWVNEGEIAGNGIDDDNNGFIDDIHGYSFFNDTPNLVGDKHGTHVAGTIAAETNNGVGVAGIAGGSGNKDGVRIMSCAIFDRFNGGGLEESFVYAADNGAVISQNSWGLIPGVEPIYETATKAGIDYFIANAGGVDQAMNGGLVLFAMGNSDTEYIESFPNAYEPVITVAATDHNDKKASYSNYGSWGDISAPGGDGKIEERVLSTFSNSEYGYLNGTSMACPHASGVAALIISKYYGNIIPNQVKTLLESTSDPIENLNPEYAGKLGTGRINALTSLTTDINSIPISFSLQERSESHFRFSWSLVSAADNYEFRYRKVGEKEWISIHNITAQHIVIDQLDKGTPYEAEVRSIILGQPSLYSERKTVWTQLNHIAVPENFKVSHITTRDATLHWDSVENAINYEINYKQNDSITWNLIKVPNTTFSYLLSELSNEKSYDVKIRAIHNEVFSSYTQTINFTTRLPICNEFDPWDPNRQYNVRGTRVSHKGFIYKSNYWTHNQEPGITDAWKKLDVCTNGGNLPPTVNISQPIEGQVFEQEILTAITLSANASDPDGTIASIQFEVNGTALTQGNNISWTPSAFGDYTIKVTATDDKGAIATDQINITIKQKIDNQPPTVNISQPTEGQIFEQEILTVITLSANASDSDGTISSIQFEVNGTSLTQGNNISWTPTAFGDYTIKVTATDDKGATASHQVSITVKETNTGGDCNDIPSWDPAVIYPSEGGVQVSYNGNIYQNKWWTQNNIPGAGGPWGPWEFIGPCSSTSSQVADSSKNFTVSPNPASNLLHIQTKKAIQGPIRITLYDVTGEHQMILDNKNLKSEVQQLSYDISHSPKGFYILKMKHNNQYYTQKIVIE